MNIISRIKLSHIKGKKEMEWTFSELHANCPNLLIAPNGFGKSTMAIAFEALKPSRIEVNKEDYYEGKEEYLPSLEIELVGEHAATLIADSIKNDIGKKVYTYVINNPVYAKSTSRNIRGVRTSSATLDVEPLVLDERIPTRAVVNYSVSELRKKYASQAKMFLNLASVFSSLKNLRIIYDNYDILKKCSELKRPSQALHDFLDSIQQSGVRDYLLQQITPEQLDRVTQNDMVASVLDIARELEGLPFIITNLPETILSAIQIIHLVSKKDNLIREALHFMEYLEYRRLVDERLKMFNTTGRLIRTQESSGKLVINFHSANKISNGERDVLNFVAHLSKFEAKINRNIGILIIDEVFDYLDGANMIAVQYYLNNLIDNFKDKGLLIFPLIFTHLDAEVFENYYFKKKKIHYLKHYAAVEDGNMLTLLKLRNGADTGLKAKVEKHYLHYHPQSIGLLEHEKALIQSADFHDSERFRVVTYDEVQRYLSDSGSYDPLKVIVAIRVRIEEVTYERVREELREEYLNVHATAKKLNFALENGAEVPEAFFLLQPLYNDALHVSENVNVVKNKIQSACLKLDSSIVQNIVCALFQPKKN